MGIHFVSFLRTRISWLLYAKMSVVPLLILLVVARGKGETYFDSVPSINYFRRGDVFDCATRYYQSELTENSSGGKISYAPAVFGGIRAINSEFRHMAAIGWEIEGGIQYLCGGSIILPKFILTAGHCSVEVNGAQPSTVRVGDTHLGNEEDDHLAQQRTIWRFLRHPLHRHSKNYHDIALIELQEEISVNENVAPACLWLEDYFPMEPMHVVGFGEVERGSGPSLTLQQGLVMVQPSDTCEPAIINRRLPDGLLGNMFCASHETMDTCQGDSGGPIEVRRIDMHGRDYSLIVGITSFGTPCGEGSTGVYTKVAAYVDWIENETNQSYEYGKCMVRSRVDENTYYGITKLPAGLPVPYVHLLKNQSADSHFNCMGTLIDDQFVLTSVSCATRHEAYPKFIYIAENNERVGIENVIPHPRYDVGNGSNDIALLKLNKFLRRGMRPVCLTAFEHPINYFSMSIVMNPLEEPIHNRSMQTKYYKRSLWYPDTNCSDQDEICWNNNFPVFPRICQLMQGGPIIMENYTNIPFIFGIINSKSSNCNSRLYGTLIDLDWIKSVLLQHLRREILIFI